MNKLRSIALGFWRLLRQTVDEFLDDDADLIAGGLAFFAVLSLAPILVLVVMLVGPLLGQRAVQSGVVEQARDLAGPQAADLVRRVLEHIGSPQLDSWSAALGVALALFGATRVFTHLQRSLNKVWDVRVVTHGKLGRGVWKVVRKRLLSGAMLLVVVVLLLASLLIGTGMELLAQHLPGVLPSGGVYRIFDSLVTLGLATVLFAVVFKLLPDAVITVRDVAVGSFVTAALFVAGKVPLTVYVGHWSMRSAFGTASSILLLLLWVYYCCSIFLLGAEFTEVFAKLHGEGIRPEEHAARVHRELRRHGDS